MLRAENPRDGSSFRRHRHELLNAMQLIRANIQLGKTDRAIAVLDRTARWLQSLSQWQTRIGDFGEAMMWAAATCPNVILESTFGNIALREAPARELMDVLHWLQSEASEIGSSVRIELMSVAEDVYYDAKIVIMASEEFVSKARDNLDKHFPGGIMTIGLQWLTDR